VGNSDLTPDDQRGLVVFPAPVEVRRGEEWWLVPVALFVAAAMIAIAFAIR
jgi:hypothetical protein